MNFFWRWIDRIATPGGDMLAVWVLFIADLAFTAFHIWQEWKGKTVPLYRVFGAIAGCWVSTWAGILLFVCLLGITQVTLGVMAYSWVVMPWSYSL